MQGTALVNLLMLQCGPLMRSLGWSGVAAYQLTGTWTVHSGRTATWAVVDNDAADLDGVTDFDDAGVPKRRYDEPDTPWTVSTNPTSVWR